MTHRPSGFAWPFIAFAVASLAPSLAGAAPRVPTHVACVGDSITYGYAASNPSTKSYPAQLQTLFGASVQVKNFGRNSATMLSAPFGDVPYEDQPEYTAASSFVSGAAASAVVDVIIMLGTNDSKPANWMPSGKPKNDQQFLSDYRAMVEHFGGLTPKPLVFLALPLATGNNPCCSIDGTVIHDQILPLIKQVAAEKNLPTIDLNTPTTGHPEYFGDGVHPNDDAYALVAKWMHDGLLVDLGSAGAGGASVGGASAGGAASTAGASGAGAGGAGGAVGGAGGASVGAGAASIGGSVGAVSGSSGLGNGGLAGAGSAVGGSSSNLTGAAPAVGGAGVPQAAGMGGAGSANSGGCALSGGNPGLGSLGAFGWLGLGWLSARRRRIRR